ncbi:hypothetical protein BDN71DRAFT_672474 [Pleurotus eryngii]|uniref:Uncharacterized protein n=1 Tax=Pleurotus eryngii TaxID=5323 RepID=A0A9P6A182_PLEER|nr:hypothetical protein BDN71DRAFT_672474 [Pleurotus eryngii]
MSLRKRSSLFLSASATCRLDISRQMSMLEYTRRVERLVVRSTLDVRHSRKLCCDIQPRSRARPNLRRWIIPIQYLCSAQRWRRI